MEFGTKIIKEPQDRFPVRLKELKLAQLDKFAIYLEGSLAQCSTNYDV